MPWPCSRGVAALAAALWLPIATTADAGADPRLYTYTAEDATYGAIGSYSNSIEKTGDVTVSTIQAHIKVSVLGISLFTQEASRIARMSAGRLLYFHGVTTENGRTMLVDGKADGDRFVVVTATGSVTVPGTIRLIDPWSAGMLGDALAMMPDTGEITRVRTTGGKETSLMLDGKKQPARLYRIDTVDGKKRYDVWLDQDGSPLMFRVRDPDSDVTFTLRP